MIFFIVFVPLGLLDDVNGIQLVVRHTSPAGAQPPGWRQTAANLPGG
jgi:hypothetical protein